MSFHLPLVSIIIPTYNRADYIIETLESVKNQTYQNWECIIVDDGSTDNTEEIVKSYIKNDSHFIYVNRPNEYLPGGCGARNYGFFISKGEYINWLDSDDLLKPNKIEKQIQLLLKYDGDLAVCDWQIYNGREILSTRSYIANNNPTNGQDVLLLMGKLNSFYIPGIYLINRKIITKSGLWNEYLKINQDGEFFCRILIQNIIVVADPDVQCLYRVHDGERTSSNLNKEKSFQRIESWKLIEGYLKLIDRDKFDSFLNVQKTGIYLKALKIGDKDVLINNKSFFNEQFRDFPFYKVKLAKVYETLYKLKPIKILYDLYKN